MNAETSNGPDSETSQDLPEADSQFGLVYAVTTRARRWLRTPSPRFARLSLALSLIVFLIAGAIAVVKLPELPTLRPLPLVMSVILIIPAILAINAVEFALAARALGRIASFHDAMRVSLLSAAANLLPVPGATVVRTTALARMGATIGRATGAGSSVALARLSTTALSAGLLLVLAGTTGPGWVAIVGGSIGCAGAFLLLRAVGQKPDVRRIAPWIFLAEVGYMFVATFRLFLVFWGLGFDASLPQVVALTLAPPLANLVGFFPSGIGLREVVAAALAPIIGLEAAVSVLVTAVDRLAGLLGMGLVAGVMTVGKWHIDAPESADT